MPNFPSQDLTDKYISASLTASVTMSVANVWYNGPSIQLGAGTWLVQAQGTLMKNTNGVTRYGFRINNGNTVYSRGESYIGASNLNSETNIKVGNVIILTGPTAITASGITDSAAAYIMHTALNQNSGSVATQIYAIKVG